MYCKMSAVRDESRSYFNLYTYFKGFYSKYFRFLQHTIRNPLTVMQATLPEQTNVRMSLFSCYNVHCHYFKNTTMIERGGKES